VVFIGPEERVGLISKSSQVSSGMESVALIRGTNAPSRQLRYVHKITPVLASRLVISSFQFKDKEND
jgi:hypothetical protein